MDKIIELKKVSKVYGDVVKTKALDEIDLAIVKGKITAVVGQSGSGKSTLLNLIGILDDITSGEIIVDGQVINKMNREEMAVFRNKTIGFVFQFHHLLPEFTIFENVVMPARIAADFSEEIDQRAIKLLKEIGIDMVMDKNSNNVSGGQKQRAAIARALINQPKIVLADEPTGNLDSVNSELVINLFRKLNKELGVTFVIITHDSEIAKKADYVIELKDGKVVRSS